MRGKNYARALTTMTDLRTSGKRPEQETWDLLIEACAVCGRWECAVEVLADLFAEEVRYGTTLKAPLQCRLSSAGCPL